MSTQRLTVWNNTGETAPAFGLAEIAGAAPAADPEEGGTQDAETLVEIRKPTGTGRVVAIGSVAIPDGGYGEACQGSCFVRYSGSEPSSGDSIEAKSGQWTAEADGGGESVTVLGDARTLGSPSFDVVRVLIGAGGGGGSTLDRGLLIESLPGYAPLGVTITPGTVKALIATREGSTWVTGQSASVVEVEPVFGEIVELSDDSCGCSGDAGGSTPGGIVIDTPIGADGDNRVYNSDDDSGAVTITGRGVAADSTVVVTITDGTTSLTPTVTVSADGTWAADSQSLTSLDRGLVKVTAQETTLDSTALTARTIAIMYSKADGGTALDAAPPQPVAPDMQAASDTGGSSSDDRTSETTPTFDVTSTLSVDTTGPVPVLLVDGVEVATDETLDINFFLSDLTRPITPTTALASGTHSVQVQLVTDDTTDAESGTSQPLWVTIDPGADEGEITATAQSSAAVDTDDETIPVDTVVITNTGMETTPSAPTSVPQPEVPISIPDETPLSLVYDGSAWALKTPTVYGRECLIGTIGGVSTLINFSSCPRLLTHAEVIAAGGDL